MEQTHERLDVEKRTIEKKKEETRHHYSKIPAHTHTFARNSKIAWIVQSLDLMSQSR